jgi:hypothetical protein
LPGLLGTLGTLLRLRPLQELRIVHTEQWRDSCCSLDHSLCQKIGRVTHTHVRQSMPACAVSDATNCRHLKLAVLYRCCLVCIHAQLVLSGRSAALKSVIRMYWYNLCVFCKLEALMQVQISNNDSIAWRSKWVISTIIVCKTYM